MEDFDLHILLERNRSWAERLKSDNPQYFSNLAKQQQPRILWIGCSDSRVAANQIVDLPPGEVFVHRNIANIVVHTDFNCLAVLEYAVEVLNVEHVVVCGHYGCGGIQAALQERSEGFVENWLEHIRDIYQLHADELEAVEEGERRENLLCELNIKKQVQNVCRTSVVEQAWRRGQPLAIHGWIYSLQDGILHDLEVTQIAKV